MLYSSHMCCPFCPFQYSNLYNIKRCKHNRTPLDSNPLNVTFTEINEEKNYIQEHLQIPIFHGEINPQILANINNNIENDILEFKNQLETAAQENAENLKKQGKNIIPFQISNTYLVTYNKKNILSISLIYQEYINGKNSYIKTTYNYNLKSGESMPLKSLFKQNVNYIEILNNKIRAKLKTSTFKGIAEDQPYYLDDNNLVIFLKFNEIAPLASEIPIIKIPLIELKDVLIDMYHFNA